MSYYISTGRTLDIHEMQSIADLANKSQQTTPKSGGGGFWDSLTKAVTAGGKAAGQAIIDKYGRPVETPTYQHSSGGTTGITPTLLVVAGGLGLVAYLIARKK